jgi:hypothetical protein
LTDRDLLVRTIQRQAHPPADRPCGRRLASGHAAMISRMAALYTKNGVPLTVRGSAVFNPSDENFGHIRGDRVYGLDGRYRGSIVNDRLVYRSTHSASIGSARAPSAVAVSARAPRAASAVWGGEPDIDP